MGCFAVSQLQVQTRKRQIQTTSSQTHWRNAEGSRSPITSVKEWHTHVMHIMTLSCTRQAPWAPKLAHGAKLANIYQA